MTRGARIRALREAQGLSLQDFAKAIRRSWTTATYIEQDAIGATAKTLEAIAKVLGVTVAQLDGKP